MDISKYLSKVIGIYLVIVSLGILLNMQQFTNSINELAQNNSLMFVTGFFTLILGVLLVVSHNIWEWHWRIIITLIAWITLLKAIGIIFYPQLMDSLTHLFINNHQAAYIAIVIDFILGVFLCFKGFVNKKYSMYL